MKNLIFLIALIFGGCSVSNTSLKVTDFAKCYIHKIPAPFWVCYQSSFIAVGKVHGDKLNRLKQEEAYSLGVSEMIKKLQAKTSLMLRRLGIKKDLSEKVKNFVIVNAVEGESWYSTAEKMIYVEVKLDKNEFKKFLFEELKNVNKEKLENAFDETF